MGQKARDGYCPTCLFTKDHGNLPFTCQIAFSDLYKSIVRFAFTKRSRVHTMNNFESQYSYYCHDYSQLLISLGCEIAECSLDSGIESALVWSLQLFRYTS